MAVAAKSGSSLHIEESDLSKLVMKKLLYLFFSAHPFQPFPLTAKHTSEKPIIKYTVFKF